ncbi:MAG: 3-oxoacyl-ACP synthase, partial [Pseudonocardiaceae bacterium]
MRFDPALPIAAVTLWSPPGRETAAEAVAAGRLDAGVAAENGYRSVLVSQLAAPELAVLAASAALAAAQWDPATVDLVVHAWTYYQGHDFWSAPHFVAHGIGAARAVPVGVQQMCNGGAAAVEVAAARLLADPDVARAVVTT